MRIAIIVSAPREMSLSAGREEINPAPLEADPKEDLPFLRVGRAKGDELHVSGPLIGDPRNPGASLELAWYFPDEEDQKDARPIDPAGAIPAINPLPRRLAEAGWRWRWRLESSRPYRAVLFFDGAFLPPFKAADICLKITHLINYDYDGHILSGLDYGHRPPSYVETDWRPPTLESQGRG